MKKKEGFNEEKSIVLPKSIIKDLKKNKLVNSLLVTDIGYYPNAYHHYRKRKGISQNILIYCVNGEGWVEIDEKKQQITENEYIIISAETAHKYGANNNNPWSIYWIHFTGNKAESLINHPNKKVAIHLTSNSRFRDRILLFEEIFNNLEMGYSKDNLEYANICLWHMLGSLRYVSQFRKVKEIQASDRISKSITYMKEHLNEKISLDTLAKDAQLSVSQFCTLFKKKTAISPLNYLTHLKIRKACNLLDFSDLKVNEIAIKVGYQDSFYFSRVFTKTMGNSPRNYRNLKKG
ncbi:helix-turn-helix domain-containing protein [Polaribacter cellanae]|uniref:AraC family transcriptional regulator n=1 Tax=Polaribacter cellanae TaxID=2818493 RepID=A0A975CSQ5_9FLAO|nr:helix-turn-helix domain-containing protein [Polaribacter cellanae]QTE22601.1 AraC family transcriptional regulator [Polaribacter cellanae]